MTRTFDLRAFVTESNRIDGILRPPDRFEIEAHERFLSLDRVTIPDIEAFVKVVAGAPLRNRSYQNVRVGDHRPPPGGPEIVTALARILDDAHGDTHPYDTHCAYETLHPFMDGNGRSGRALWAWQMRRQGRPFERIGFLHAFYYQSLDRGRR